MTEAFVSKILYLIGYPQNALAATTRISLFNPLGGDNLVEVAENISAFLLDISIPIVVIMILVGGFQIMFAAGNPEKVSTGKKTILYAAVGFVVVLIASSVTTIIKSIIR